MGDWQHVVLGWCCNNYKTRFHYAAHVTMLNGSIQLVATELFGGCKYSIQNMLGNITDTVPGTARRSTGFLAGIGAIFFIQLGVVR